MSELPCKEFQQTVSNFLLRHQSILDLLSKNVEAAARVNRAVTKAVTSCGCLQIKSEKKAIPPEASLENLKDLFSSHLYGEMCENCRETVINELGKNLFYITALCNALDISLQDVLEEENNKVTTLGRFNMT